MTLRTDNPYIFFDFIGSVYGNDWPAKMLKKATVAYKAEIYILYDVRYANDYLSNIILGAYDQKISTIGN